MGGIYFPPARTQGAWRSPANDAELSSLCGLNPEKLKTMAKTQDFINGGEEYAIVIIRRGYFAAEYRSKNVYPNEIVNIHSCSKSFTSLAFGCLFEEKKSEGFSLDSKAYDYIPQGHPLTDPKKADITVRHLLSMSSGIAGESHGLVVMGDVNWRNGEFEHALGLEKSEHGQDLSKLVYDPGTGWDYSDGGFVHLALIFQQVCGRDMFQYLAEKLLDPIGVQGMMWDMQGGYGHIGPYTNTHSGVHISARELARVGYLLMNGGQWDGRQIISGEFIKEACAPSQPYNPDYGLGFWNNASGYNRIFPRDMFAMKGYNSNRLYIVPSEELVVARVGEGPTNWDENILLGGVLAAIERG